MAAELTATHTRPLALPALITGAGDRAALRLLEYFTVNIRNCNKNHERVDHEASLFGLNR